MFVISIAIKLMFPDSVGTGPRYGFKNSLSWTVQGQNLEVTLLLFF